MKRKNANNAKYAKNACARGKKSEREKKRNFENLKKRNLEKKHKQYKKKNVEKKKSLLLLHQLDCEIIRPRRLSVYSHIVVYNIVNASNVMM